MKWSINFFYYIFDQNVFFTCIFSGIGIRVFLSPSKLKDRKQKSKKTFRKKLHFRTPFQKEEIAHPWCVTKMCHTHITHGLILSIQRSKFSVRKTEHCGYSINEFAVHGNCQCLIYITLFWVPKVCGQNPMEWPSTMTTILQLCLDRRTDIQLISERISRNHLYL